MAKSKRNIGRVSLLLTIQALRKATGAMRRNLIRADSVFTATEVEVVKLDFTDADTYVATIRSELESYTTDDTTDALAAVTSLESELSAATTDQAAAIAALALWTGTGVSSRGGGGRPRR